MQRCTAKKGESLSDGTSPKATQRARKRVRDRRAEAQSYKGMSQRYYRLKFADTYYGEMTHYGLYRLAWADVRRTRT